MDLMCNEDSISCVNFVYINFEILTKKDNLFYVTIDLFPNTENVYK